ELPRTVVLCGSTRFADAFAQATIAETLAGRIVLGIGVDLRTYTGLLTGLDETHRAQLKAALARLHLHKIDAADEVLVLNVGGYVGASTTAEITYAHAAGKPVRYLEPDLVPGATA